MSRLLAGSRQQLAVRGTRVCAYTRNLHVANNRCFSEKVDRESIVIPALPAARALLNDLEFSSQQMDPLTICTEAQLFEKVTKLFSDTTIGIPVTSEDIEIIASPPEFYQGILDLIRSAKRRVVISALYIGSGESEQAIFKAIDTQLAREPQLQVHFQFDGFRGGRVDADGGSSLSQCETLIAAHPSRVTASFIKVPLHARAAKTTKANTFPRIDMDYEPSFNLLRKWLDRQRIKQPGKTQEVASVHHWKYYLCDDTVILTGANASAIYFEKRQDRYMKVRNAMLTDWLVSLSQAVTIAPTVSTLGASLPRVWSSTSYQGQSSLGDRQANVLALVAAGSREDKNSSARMDQWIDTLRVLFRPTDNSSTRSPICIYPAMQCAGWGVQQDHRLFCELLHMLTFQPVKMLLQTGYFNFLNFNLHQMARLSHADTQVQLVTGGLSANGWSGSKGKEAQVPVQYQHVLAKTARFFRRLNPRVRVEEYTQEGWSFHGKGIWQQTHQQHQFNKDAAFLTVVGSSNFGMRSTHLDNELQMYIVSQKTSDTLGCPPITKNNAHAILTDPTKPLNARLTAEARIISQSTTPTDANYLPPMPLGVKLLQPQLRIFM